MQRDLSFPSGIIGLDSGVYNLLLIVLDLENGMDNDYLSRCVVDPLKRKIYLYSEEGKENVVDCDTVEEFMSALDFVRKTLDEDTLSYANPL